MTAEKKAIAWLEHVREWLNRYEDSALSKPALLLVRKLERDCDRGEMKAAWDVIRDLEGLGEKSEQLETAEIHLHCGLAAAKMDSFKEAKKFFITASSKYAGFHHRQAIAWWMAGCIQWLLPGEEVEAIHSWRSAVRIFENLCKGKENQKAIFDWYSEKCAIMNSALDEATDSYEIPSLPNSINDFSNGMGNGKPDGKNTDEPPSGRLALLQVYEHINAGAFGPASILSSPSGSLEVDRVFIGDKPFWILSLKGRRVIRVFTRDCVLIKVSGDSMNEANIQDGDFVLLKLLPRNVGDFNIHQVYPEDNSQPGGVFDDGDIVAAEIRGEDDSITLKRALIRSGKIILRAESTNPKYKGKSWEFDASAEGFFVIVGVAIAVLKPL